MGKIQNLTDTGGIKIYPVTVSDAVIVGTKTLTKTIEDSELVTAAALNNLNERLSSTETGYENLERIIEEDEKITAASIEKIRIAVGIDDNLEDDNFESVVDKILDNNFRVELVLAKIDLYNGSLDDVKSDITKIEDNIDTLLSLSGTINSTLLNLTLTILQIQQDVQELLGLSEQIDNTTESISLFSELLSSTGSTVLALSNSVQSKADNISVVHNTGNETVSGVKTFLDDLVLGECTLHYDPANKCIQFLFN